MGEMVCEEKGKVEVTSAVQWVGEEEVEVGGRRRASPSRVTVTLGASTRINMNSSRGEEQITRREEERSRKMKERMLREEGACSLPNLSLLRAEARTRRPRMGTAR